MKQLAKTATTTMSSVELVAVINELREEGKAELRHDHFMVKIENHPGIMSPKFLGHIEVPGPNGGTRKSKCYHLPKRECELMVMSESLAVQTRVYDRMRELELLQLGNVTKKPASIIPVAKEFTQAFKIARLMGCDRNSASISANNFVYQTTGTNVMSLLGMTHLESEKQALCFSVSDLMDGVSGVKMNKMLQAAGMQTNQDGRWVPTDAGGKFSKVFDTGKRHGNGTPVQQVKWFKTVLEKLSIAESTCATE
jgi:hypothetical protein